MLALIYFFSTLESGSLLHEPTYLSPKRQCRSGGYDSPFLRRVEKVGGFVLQRRHIVEDAGGELEVNLFRLLERNWAVYVCESNGLDPT